MNYIIHTDGGARGNPGPSAVGVFIQSCTCADIQRCKERDKKIVAGFGKTIGEGTNNVAEYTAVVEALRFLMSHDGEKSRGETKIAFYLDSTLVVNQLNGVFKVKDSTLRNLLTSVRMLESQVGGEISYTYVPREQNADADAYVNIALNDAGF